MKTRVFNAVMLATPNPINKEDLFIIWDTYIPRSFKYFIGVKNTNLYFEVTYNIPKDEWCVDVYSKVSNRCISTKDLETYTKINSNNI